MPTGYDCIVVRDEIASTSPEGGLENAFYNACSVGHRIQLGLNVKRMKTSASAEICPMAWSCV